MQIVDPIAMEYAERYTSEEDPLLKEVSVYTLKHHPKSHMISGHLQGQFLKMISRMMRPKRILEIGTFTGYSALCLAEGLTDDGELHTVELREADAAVAQKFFDQKKTKKIILHVGEARHIIDQLDESWDMVFIDADKVNYTYYFMSVLPKVRSNGIILVDNVLFHGEVLSAEVKGKNAKAIQEFNDFVRQRNDIERLLLPLRDGLFVIRKI